MNNQQLQKLVKKISLKYFNYPYTGHATFYGRLRSTGGRCFMVEPFNIQINPKMYYEYDLDTLIGIIKHELCHYYLAAHGMTKHRHDSNEFVCLLHRVGGLRYAPITSTISNHKVLIYQCNKCHHEYRRLRRLSKGYIYFCSQKDCNGGKCKGKISLKTIIPANQLEQKHA